MNAQKENCMFVKNDYNPITVALRIKSVLKTKKMTQKELFTALGMAINTLDNYKKSMPKSDNLAWIADYLDCSVDYLLGRSDNPNIGENNINNFDTTINGTQANIIQGAETDLDEIKAALSKLTSSKRHRAIADMLDLLEEKYQKN